MSRCVWRCAKPAWWVEPMSHFLRLLPFGALSLALGVAGCSIVHDRGDDYRSAKNLPAMQFPQGPAVRPLKDLYPIPAESTAGVVPAVVTNKSGKFEVPKPKPLVVAELGAPEKTPTDNGPENTLALSQDGNGYPTLNASGSFNQIWDTLDTVLRQAGIKVDDRNQSLGLYYLTLQNPPAGKKTEPFQLKITRGMNAYTLSLQKDDDTLAPQAVASDLFDKIQAKWHTSSGDNDGKARAPLHR